MIAVGLAFLLTSAVLAAAGVAGYLAARRSTSKSRLAAMTLLGHGALSSAGAIAALFVFHIHSVWPLFIHVHSGTETLEEILECDLEAGCVPLIIGTITAVILLSSLFASQTSARLLLRRNLADADAVRAEALVRRRPLPSADRVLVVRDHDLDAYSFGILRRRPGGWFRVEDVIVLTSGLLDLLSEDEADAVLAHEVAHVQARDDRYLPFFHALSTLMFFDPVLRYIRRRVARHHEFAADLEAAKDTGRPLSLARALLKIYTRGIPAPHPTGLFGRVSRAEIVERIEALLALEAAGLGKDPVTVCRDR